MADLLDIVTATAVEAVTITGAATPVDVRRLRVDEVAALIVRFPSAVLLLTGAGDSVATLLNSPGLVAIIAAGCGHIGDEKSEALIGSFSIEDQLKLLNAILRLTVPNGFGSVMQEVETLARLIGGASEAPKGDNKAAKPEAVKLRLKPSPSPSPPLSGEASRPTMS